jgi:hypothetical protein
MTDQTMFMARVSNRAGRKLYETAAYPTRDEATAMAFRACPKAKSCSTARAHWIEASQSWFAASDIQWANNPDWYANRYS